jgi:hypothetical protein
MGVKLGLLSMSEYIEVRQYLMPYNDFNLFSNATIRVNIRIFTVLFKHMFQHDSIVEINIWCKYTETDSE